MQEDMRRTKADHTRSVSGLVGAASFAFEPLSSADTASRAAFRTVPVPLHSSFRPRSQTKGWAVKAFEFLNSGPPALLNNPPCSRRIVCCPFLKHAMEVHYG